MKIKEKREARFHIGYLNASADDAISLSLCFYVTSEVEARTDFIFREFSASIFKCLTLYTHFDVPVQIAFLTLFFLK